MPSTNFYFGRLNFKHQLTSLDDFSEDLSRAERIKRALLSYIQTDGPVFTQENGNIEWVFGVCYEEGDYLLGKFGKVYPNRPTRYDYDRGEFIEENEEGTQADYSMFLIYPEENLIVFNQRQNIGYRQFQQAFSAGYNKHLGLDDALNIGLLQDTRAVEDLISESQVMYATFDLVPTNPTSDPDMQVLDNHIQNMEADSFNMSVQTDGGINMDDDLMQAALNMSTAGYGNFELEYEQDDRVERYKSANRPAAQEIDRPSTLDDLYGAASDLIDRAHELIHSDD